LNEHSSKKLDQCLEILSYGNPIVPKTLEMWGRKMVIEETCGRIGKTTFHHLCGEARSSAEFLQIANDFDVLIIKDIPRLDLSTRNEARRFITLIDSLYDSRVKLIASFETDLNDLFDGSPIKGIPIQSDDRLLLDDLNLSTSEVIFGLKFRSNLQYSQGRRKPLRSREPYLGLER
jgi:peroxisome-assembly ATPase